MWMFVEGIHLHNIIAVSFFSGKPNYFVYYVLGWGKSHIIYFTYIATENKYNLESCQGAEIINLSVMFSDVRKDHCNITQDITSI